MNISKDEARILAAALIEYKYQLVNEKNYYGLMHRLDKLEAKLDDFSKDKRRTGRTSQDNFNDCLKRFIWNG